MKCTLFAMFFFLLLPLIDTNNNSPLLQIRNVIPNSFSDDLVSVEDYIFSKCSFVNKVNYKDLQIMQRIIFRNQMTFIIIFYAETDILNDFR